MITEEKVQSPVGVAWLYPPSFIDRFMLAVRRLPIPFWLVYILLFTLQGLLNFAIALSEGQLPLANFSGILFIFPLWQWIPLGIVTYLNITSRKVLGVFRPLLKIDDAEYALLKAEFTTMPPRGVLISGLFWLVVYTIANIQYQSAYRITGIGPFAHWALVIEGAICFTTGSVVYFHSLRQLTLIHRTVQRAEHFNLFALEPVYAFSRLTAQTGISWVLLTALTFLLFPFVLAPELMLAFAVIMLFFALAAFALPLQAVNQHLVLEKRALLAEHQLRVEATLNRLHGQLDQGEMTNIEKYEKAVLSLTEERKILDEIPTWPWRTTTLTGFLSAAVLPILLLLIQIVIQRWLAH